MLFQYILGELGIKALAYAQNSLFVRTFVCFVLGLTLVMDFTLNYTV